MAMLERMQKVLLKIGGGHWVGQMKDGNPNMTQQSSTFSFEVKNLVTLNLSDPIIHFEVGKTFEYI